MKIGTIVTATDLNPLYIDFIPLFIKAWNKIIPNADVKIVLIGEEIPENLQKYSNNIVLIKPIEGIKTQFIAQSIRLLYPRDITRNEGVIITDMDMIPLNKSFYVDPIKDIDDTYFVVYGAEGHGINTNKPSQIWICYNVATPNTWKQMFGNDNYVDIIKKWYSETNYNGGHGASGWFSDQEQLTKYFNNYKGNKVIIPKSKLNFNRLDRGQTEPYKNLEKLKSDIQSGVYSDYHVLRPYNEHKDINDFIVENIPQYSIGGKRRKRRTIKKRKSKKTKSRKLRRQKGGNNEDELQTKYATMYGIKKTIEQMNNPNIIYVKVDYLNDFKIPDHKFILVTGASDYTLPDDYREKFNQIINHPNLIHWFSQNLTEQNDKLTIFPIGIDYHTKADLSPLKQEEELLEIVKKNLPFYKRINKIYCNFSHAIRGRYGETDRKASLEQIPSNLLVKEESYIDRKQSWNNMIKYAFVASPHGNGLDCHRTWEALALGCIPIVKSSPIDPLYDELPVLIVKEWNNINEELLINTINSFKSKKFNMVKMTLEYWINKIKEYNLIKGGNRKSKIIKIKESNFSYLETFNTYDKYYLIIDYYNLIRDLIKKCLTSGNFKLNIVLGNYNENFHNSNKLIQSDINLEHTLVRKGYHSTEGAPIGKVKVLNNYLGEDKNEYYLVRIHEYELVNKNDIIFEYSLPNIYNIKQLDIYSDYVKKIVYVAPILYQYYDKKENRINNSITTFVDMRERRIKLLDSLNKINIGHKNINNVFAKEELKKLYYETRILINIHQAEYPHTFEELRVLPALLCGVIVIAEESPLKEEVPYHEYIIWSPYDLIAEKTKEVLDNYDSYHTKIFGDKKLKTILHQLELNNYTNLVKKLEELNKNIK